MGLEKAGLTLGEKIIAWTRSGKSLLATRQVKIKPEELGFRFPNGSINFQTEDAAIKYIKNRLLDSVKRPEGQQFERCISKRGTTVLSETNGSRNYCKLPFSGEDVIKMTSGNPVRNMELWHSHPDMYGIGKTAPLSSPECGDLETFNSLYLKRIVAMNSKGEINSMEALSGYSKKQFKNFQQNFDKFMESKVLELLPENVQIRIKEIEKIIKNNNHGTIPKEIEKEIENIEQLMIKSQSSGEAAQLMHEYYKTASRYGMKYYTNFSNLV